MNYSDIRRLLLKVFIGFLSVTALVTILSVLGGKFGETQVKVLFTTFSISAGSICAMSCAAFLEWRGTRAVGRAGIFAAGVAVLMVVSGVWGDISEADYWKTTVTFIVVAIAFAHACLLRLPTLALRHRWTQTVSTILIALLALQIILAVWREVRDEGYYRCLAAVSVLVVLVTLIIPICSRLRGKEDKAPQDLDQAAEQLDQLPEHLVLHKVSGPVFADAAGRRFHVTEIKAQSGRPEDCPPGSHTT